MTDLEITKLCAEAMALEFKVARELWCGNSAPLAVWTKNGEYQPLHDDAQAMALVKRLELWIQPPRQGHLSGTPSDYWFVAHSAKGGDSRSLDLNQTICECAAKIQKAKVPT